MAQLATALAPFTRQGVHQYVLIFGRPTKRHIACVVLEVFFVFGTVVQVHDVHDFVVDLFDHSLAGTLHGDTPALAVNKYLQVEIL